VQLGDYAASDYGMTANSNPSFEDETLLLRGIPEDILKSRQWLHHG